MPHTTSALSRRRFLAASGGVAAALSLSAPSDAADMTATERANVDLVNRFCAAWSSPDLEKVLAFFADNGVYRMTETMPPSNGREGLIANIKRIIDRVEKFEVLDTFARGPMVVNERIDTFSNFALKKWHGVGVFLIKDGKIVEWFDYTIDSERA